MILGIDEVGRGPWAGPLVVGAVVLDGAIDGLTDSKKLSAKRRLTLDAVIRESAAGYGLGWVMPDELDQVGLAEALRLATIRAVEQITVPYHEIMIDGTVNFLAGTTKERYVTTLPKGDLLVPSISAASIIAKVARDTYMVEQDERYPGYGFKSHVGYGTALHRQAIERLGLTPLHRRSFAPIARYAGSDIVTTTTIGNRAEDIVANHLKSHGHTILDRNWKTRYCEIDIVSEKNGIVYFTEVKYRRGTRQGGGLAAITLGKLAQMRFAAELYRTTHAHDGEARLVAAAVDRNDRVESILEIE